MYRLLFLENLKNFEFFVVANFNDLDFMIEIFLEFTASFVI